MNTKMFIPKIVTLSFALSDTSNGQPSIYPSGPLASVGQLSKLSTIPSSSVSFSLAAQPFESTKSLYADFVFGHKSGLFPD